MNIQEIVEKLNLPYSVNAIDSKGELWMSCPLNTANHKKGDQRPSFSINMDSGDCYCFVCGGGNVEFLVQSILGISSNEAKKWLSAYESGNEEEDDFKKRIRERLCNNVSQGHR